MKQMEYSIRILVTETECLNDSGHERRENELKRTNQIDELRKQVNELRKTNGYLIKALNCFTKDK